MSDKLRELILWRHAKSDWGDPTLADIDRPLSERGRRNAKKMAHWLQQPTYQPDLILCSNAKRTQQTLRRLCQDCDTQVRILDTLYHAELPQILSQLAQVEVGFKRVMLIGHNPGLETLIEFLLDEPVHLGADAKLFPTAAVAKFIMPADWTQLERGDGKLVAITRPKDI
jgi:phosphohistidine phosphatase